MSRRVDASRTTQQRAICDADCALLQPEASREAARRHTAQTGHRTRFVTEESTTYERVIERFAEGGDRLTAEQMFARAVAARRQDLGWSQERLADELSSRGLVIRQTGITRLENGDRGIGLGEAETIAGLLGIERSEWSS